MNFSAQDFTGIIGVGGGIAQGLSNLRYQKQNLAYQKQLQQQIFEREDTAVQRRVADLEKAGLSKTLAAGDGAGAGAVVATQAPENDTLARVAQGLSLAKTSAEVDSINTATANAVKQGALIDEQVVQAKKQQAYIEAQTALTTGNFELLGLSRQKMESEIKKILADVDYNLVKQGYTKSQIDYVNAQIGYLGSQSRYLSAQSKHMDYQNALLMAQTSHEQIKSRLSAQDLELFDLRKQMLQNQLAGVIFDNEMKSYENQFVDLFGNKMPVLSSSKWDKYGPNKGIKWRQGFFDR